MENNRDIINEYILIRLIELEEAELYKFQNENICVKIFSRSYFSNIFYMISIFLPLKW